MQRPSKRSAFTLVELLVVIGIIAVLISMLLPALNRARSAARMISCAAIQRQLASAVLMYANESGGSFPRDDVVVTRPTDPTLTWTLRWWHPYLLGKYMGNREQNPVYTRTDIFFCPANTRGRSSAVPPLFGNDFGIGYNAHPDARLWKGSAGKPPAKLGRVKNSAGVLVFADVSTNPANAQGYQGSAAFKQMYSGHIGFLLPMTDAISYRHSLRANVAFMDGHVEAFKVSSPDRAEVNNHKSEGFHAEYLTGRVDFVARKD